MSGGRRRAEDEEVKISKGLSYLLRHGAVKEKLNISPDGYVDLEEILRHNRMKSLHATEATIDRVVANNDKNRFEITLDPETGRRKIRARQGHSIKVVKDDLLLTELKKPYDFIPPEIIEEFKKSNGVSTLTEEQLMQLYKTVNPVVIHGTYKKFLQPIQQEGLNRMGRNHIHFAQGVPAYYAQKCEAQAGVVVNPDDYETITGIRRNVNVIIYLDYEAVLANEPDIKFYRSDNGVILSGGNKDGIIPSKYFAKIVTL